MAHYALIDALGQVVSVFVGRDEDDKPKTVKSWETYYALPGLTVKRTSYNTHAGAHRLGGTPYRGNYAGIGFTYDEAQDAFIPPRPTDDSTYDPATYSWLTPDTEGDPE